MANRDRTTCRRCRQEIEVNDRGISVYLFGQTIGVKPRRKSAASSLYICPECIAVMGAGQPPPDWDFFNLAAYEMVRNLLGLDRPETQEAFARFFELVIEREGKIQEAELLALAEPEVLAPTRRLKAS